MDRRRGGYCRIARHSTSMGMPGAFVVATAGGWTRIARRVAERVGLRRELVVRGLAAPRQPERAAAGRVEPISRPARSRSACGWPHGLGLRVAADGLAHRCIGLRIRDRGDGGGRASTTAARTSGTSLAVLMVMTEGPLRGGWLVALPRMTPPQCPGPSRSGALPLAEPPMFKTAVMRPFRTWVAKRRRSARDDLQHVRPGRDLHRDLDAAVRLAHLPAAAPAVEVDGLPRARRAAACARSAGASTGAVPVSTSVR